MVVRRQHWIRLHGCEKTVHWIRLHGAHAGSGLDAVLELLNELDLVHKLVQVDMDGPNVKVVHRC